MQVRSGNGVWERKGDEASSGALVLVGLFVTAYEKIATFGTVARSGMAEEALSEFVLQRGFFALLQVMKKHLLPAQAPEVEWPKKPRRCHCARGVSLL